MMWDWERTESTRFLPAWRAFLTMHWGEGVEFCLGTSSCLSTSSLGLGASWGGQDKGRGLRRIRNHNDVDVFTPSGKIFLPIVQM